MYKKHFTPESFQNRIKNLSNDIDSILSTDISGEISFILDNFDQINEIEKQFEILYFLKIVSNVEHQRTIDTLNTFPLIDFLMIHFQSPLFENHNEIFIEIIGSILKNSSNNKPENLLDFFLTQLFNFNPWANKNTNLLYHILYAIYQFFSETFSNFFYQKCFYEKLTQFFNLTPEIDILLLQYALKCAKSFIFSIEVVQYILYSIQFYNDESADIISYIIYQTYKRDPKVLEIVLVKETITKCISNSNSYNSQKYALKLLNHLQENDIQFLNYKTIIADSIYEIFTKMNNQDNQLLIYSISVVYRTLQISSSLAESLFFNSHNQKDIILLISEIILTNDYKSKNWGIKVFSQIMRNLPTKIYPFLTKPELQKIFYDILITVIDIDENEDSLIIFMTSIDQFINTLSSNENLLLIFLSIFHTEEILSKISALSNSANEELSATFQMISENLSNIADNLTIKK